MKKKQENKTQLKPDQKTEQLMEQGTVREQRTVPCYMLRMTSAYDRQLPLLPPISGQACLEDIPGTNCYCDEEAIQEIRHRLENLPLKAIHLIDSGNYHYLTRLWLERIDEEFALVLLDNHTDMQLPAFGEILSCGGWAASAIDELPKLRHVCLIGPPAEDLALCPAYPGKLSLLSSSDLAAGDRKREVQLLETVCRSVLPVYLSIDKDLLCQNDAVTGWSQGSLSLEELESLLERIAARLNEAGCSFLGADICGEAPDEPEAVAINGRANDRLIRKLQQLFGENRRRTT